VISLGTAVPLAPRFGSVTLVVSDVDDTLAPPFHDISASLAQALTRLVGNGTILFLVSGQGIGNIERRVVRAFPRPLRRRILVGHCHGAEVFGYDRAGRHAAKAATRSPRNSSDGRDLLSDQVYNRFRRQYQI
jgi:hypothetical protein